MLTQRGPAPYLIDHAPGRGAIARFDQDTVQIIQVLDMLKASGADGISLSLWLWEGIGDNDQYLDWTPAIGLIVPKMEANLVGLLKAIAERFNWIQVAPQFYDPDQARVAKTGNQSWPRNVGMDAFDSNWLFMYWLYTQLDSLGIDFMIDAVPEFNDVYLGNPGFQQYVKAMWDNVTLTSAPGGIPCWRYSMSFVMANWAALVDAFQGNIPGFLLPHPYSGDLVSLEGNLSAKGLGGIPWIAGEDFTLQAGDEATVQKWVSFVQQTHQRVMRVCPWPIPTTWKDGESFLAPPLAPKLWASM